MRFKFEGKLTCHEDFLSEDGQIYETLICKNMLVVNNQIPRESEKLVF